MVWDPWALNEAFGGFETAGALAYASRPTRLIQRAIPQPLRLTDGARLPNPGPSVLPFLGTGES